MARGRRTTRWTRRTSSSAVGARFDDRITGKLSRVRPAGEVHPHRHRPRRDLQERPGPHPDRRRCEEHPRALARRSTARWSPSRLASRSGGNGSRGWREKHPLAYDDSDRRRDQAAAPGPGALRGDGQGDCILSTDVGQHQMWAAQYFHFDQPRRWIHSGGLGTMGFGLPAAMGAPGCPARTPDHHADPGDGVDPDEHAGWRRSPTYAIPVKVFIMNNGYLGMVRQWQELFWDRRYLARRHERVPRLRQARRGPMGGTAVRLSDKPTLVEDLRAVLAREGPVIFDVRVTREETAYPMIPPGPARPEHGGMSDGRARHEGAPVASRPSRPRPACARAANTSSRSSSSTSRPS